MVLLSPPFNFFTLFFLLNITILNATELKIASYNIENLFDMHYDSSEYKQYIPNRHNWAYKNLNKKLTNISEVICDINADIIGLQEVENQNALKLLQKSLKKHGCAYRYSAITQKTKSTIQVALLSKLPIQKSRDIVVNYSLGQRNILETKFIIDNNPLYIFVNHWSSKYSPESKRILSAKALKKRILELPKEAEYILLGDFNSNYNEYKTIKPKHNDSNGKTGINHILNSINITKLEMKNVGFRHYNLWLELLKFKRWSHNYYGDKQGLDAILLPPTLFNGKGIDYVNNTFSVLKKKYLFHKKGYIYRWEYRRDRHSGKGYSDHLPVTALFSTKPYIFKSKSKIKKDSKIEELYTKNSILPLELKNVKVIFKRGYHAIIKQSKSGRAIFVYGAGKDLEEGMEYNIVVSKTKEYKGLNEIVEFSVKKKYGAVDIELYIQDRLFMVENEVLKNIEGEYRDEKFYIGQKSYPIHFKKRELRPKNGVSLQLKRVQVGYYKSLQFVVWDAKDFEVIPN